MWQKLPDEWVERLAAQPESGMGIQVVDVTLVDGRVLPSLIVRGDVIKMENPVTLISKIELSTTFKRWI